RLTGLYNRHYMIEYLEALDDESSGCLAMADIDYFKNINDVYGHHAGDMILVSAADALKNCEGCVTARWGGEEFLIHLPMDKEKAQEMLERLREDIASEKHEFDGKEISVTVTIGLSERLGRNADDWIKDADSRLYDGKNSGRNRVVI
ncbi:MAG: GGDEF domain-containing protein, partial [Oscillospiraceae bacterium]|nr:GGDEF domain-containing protein [Oscillospiraceae bacterium]